METEKTHVFIDSAVSQDIVEKLKPFLKRNGYCVKPFLTEATGLVVLSRFKNDGLVDIAQDLGAIVWFADDLMNATPTVPELLLEDFNSDFDYEWFSQGGTVKEAVRQFLYDSLDHEALPCTGFLGIEKIAREHLASILDQEPNKV